MQGYAALLSNPPDTSARDIVTFHALSFFLLSLGGRLPSLCQCSLTSISTLSIQSLATTLIAYRFVYHAQKLATHSRFRSYRRSREVRLKKNIPDQHPAYGRPAI
ncbi:hypothetical protein HII31_07951 [Pseudocercospora fuligena]|uniref:Uncharacterized protein n=1 Tax=Pseudocercospora fuligena TaxID=685502 RepID=A0A8H6RHR0_9PEZI|nr:hypothetical protein HII31_07951 [Pseudocercospora fuligena]